MLRHRPAHAFYGVHRFLRQRHQPECSWHPGCHHHHQFWSIQRFTQTVQGNPVGVNNAAAVATILWPDGSTQVENATTGSDGIAVFAIPLRPSAINHLVQIQITFISGSETCTIPSAAYFTAIVASPTATNTAMPSPTTTSTPTVTPTGSLTPVGTGIPTITPTV